MSQDNENRANNDNGNRADIHEAENRLRAMIFKAVKEFPDPKEAHRRVRAEVDADPNLLSLLQYSIIDRGMDAIVYAVRAKNMQAVKYPPAKPCPRDLSVIEAASITYKKLLEQGRLDALRDALAGGGLSPKQYKLLLKVAKKSDPPTDPLVIVAELVAAFLVQQSGKAKQRGK